MGAISPWKNKHTLDGNRHSLLPFYLEDLEGQQDPAHLGHPFRKQEDIVTSHRHVFWKQNDPLKVYVVMTT